MQNYSIIWERDNSADYKFFHSRNSIITAGMKQGKHKYPFRYPFADVFIYSYNDTYNVFTYRKESGFSKCYYSKGFKPAGNGTQTWPHGTKLTKFADFEMRVAVDNQRYLESWYSPNWKDVGVTPSYDHFTDDFKNPKSFEIPPELYSPAMPFCLSTIKCWREMNIN